MTNLVERKIDEKIEHLASTVVLESQLTRDQLGATFAQTLRGNRLDGALSRPLRVNAINYGANGRLVGWSLRAVAADVTVTLHDGQSTDADTIATVFIPSGTSSNVGTPGSGIGFVDALYAEVTLSVATGSVVGALWFGAVD